MAERLEMKLETFDIIYKLVEWLEGEAKVRMPKEIHDEVVGKAKVLKVFSKDKDRQIIGGRVELGTLSPGANFKIVRREHEVGRGKLRGLQHLKQKADEVKKGMEFGAMIEAVIEIAPGDALETFITTIQ